MTSPDRAPDGITPSQTVGPFFAYCLTPGEGRHPFNGSFTADLASRGTHGKPISLEGSIIDGDGKVVPDAMVEIWQADDTGRYPSPPHSGFSGFGRAACDAEGRYRFVTVKPSAVPEPNGAVQAPHISVAIFARGLLRQLHTRIYFADEATANAGDPVLAQVPPERRDTLLARRVEVGRYALDVRLQGADETVFFEV